MPTANRKKLPSDQDEGAKDAVVYHTLFGRYIKPGEFLRSKQGREALAKARAAREKYVNKSQ
ncbi:MAG: hypothetical protein OXG09_06380 [Chloroflexi bacterium]|nr:hypothetical protein [Chloroflexota bacterium]